MLISARNLLNLTCSLFSDMAFLAFGGVISSILSSTFSIEWYFLIIASAVLGQTPGAPGILSELSPINAFISINSEGVTP